MPNSTSVSHWLNLQPLNKRITFLCVFWKIWFCWLPSLLVWHSLDLWISRTWTGDFLKCLKWLNVSRQWWRQNCKAYYVQIRSSNCERNVFIYVNHFPLIKSNQIKSLLLSHHHSTSALVSEILMSVLQTVQKKQQQQFTYGQTVQKNNNNNLHMDRQCKKTTNNLHMDRQCKKTTTTIYIWTDSAKKTTRTIYIWTDSAKKQQTIYIWTDSAKKQQQFTYGQYIFTDYTEDNVQNTHTYTQYT